MNHGGDVAEQLVRLSLNGLEVAAKITGTGAKHLAILLFTILHEDKKTKGKARLTNMLKSGKELKVFSLKNGDIQKFLQEAKRYGVLYCVLKDKNDKSPDGIVDIIARAEDASKISRIIDRFKLATVDKASIASRIEQTLEAVSKGGNALDINQPNQEKADNLLDDLQIAPFKEAKESENPIKAQMEKSNLSEPFSKSLNNLEKDSTKKKPSIREELNQIKMARKKKNDPYLPDLSLSTDKKLSPPSAQHQQPIRTKLTEKKVR